MKRILFITNDYPPKSGGQSRLCGYVVESLKRKYDVRVVNLYTGEGLNKNFLKIFFRLPFSEVFQLWLIILKFGVSYDLVIAMDVPRAVHASLFGFLTGKKV